MGMALDTEIKFDTERGVSTEDRFGLRRFFETMLAMINTGDWEQYVLHLDETVEVRGFTEVFLSKDQYLEFFKKLNFGTDGVVARYPTLLVSVKQECFCVRGRFEGFVDGVLTHEGNIEFIVKRFDDCFKVMEIIFYPHMTVRPEV